MIDLIKYSAEDKMICDKLEPFLTEAFAQRGVMYHIEQAIEKQLIALLLLAGTEPPYIHDITRLNNMCKEVGYDMPSQLDYVSDTLTVWETKTRYDPFIDYSAEKYATAKEAYVSLAAMTKSIVEQITLNESEKIIPEPPSSGRK